jgi:hypothetical protein
MQGTLVKPMSLPPALRSFVDDELMRAPLLIEQTLDGAAESLRQPAPATSATDRTMSAELLTAVTNLRLRAVAAYVAELRKQVATFLTPAGAPATPKTPGPMAPTLSLVDEAEVAVDVVLSRAIEAIRSVAEAELRELRAYTSALAGDMDVAGDHNPVRPEVQARALWAAAQTLAPTLGFQVAFMRHASMPLAQVLRKSYAAACSRLANTGVEPAAYRTLILPAGTRTERRSFDGEPVEDEAPNLQVIRETMPVPRNGPSSSPAEFDDALQQAGEQLLRLPADTGKAEFGRLREAQRSQLVERAASPVDQQLIELLSRLFDAIVADRRLLPDVQGLLSRLQASVLRVALRDPSTLDDHDHPVWQFMDRLAFAASTLPAGPDPERERLVKHAQAVIEHLIGERTHDAALYRWALGRLTAYERHRHERRVAAAAGQIARLQAQDAQMAMAGPPLPPSASTLDLQQLDTVPADLLDATPPEGARKACDTAAWLDERAAGDWVRIFVQGGWVQAELLWAGPHRQLWLLADGAGPGTWAVRRAALTALHEAGLLESLKPRSLLRRAARRVLRRIEST